VRFEVRKGKNEVFLKKTCFAIRKNVFCFCFFWLVLQLLPFKDDCRA
jgi:hypothetical protein